MFILSILEETTNVWVGGRRLSDDSWIWLDGTEFSYTNWATGEPNNKDDRGDWGEDAIVINDAGKDGKWNDLTKIDTWFTQGFLCQYLAF